MITSVTSSVDNSSASDKMKKSFGMDSEAFLKLFVAQMQYQDPLKPQDSSAMLEQISQLTLVEQSYNSTAALKNLLAAQNNSVALNSATFIGGNVKANGTAINFDGNTSVSLQFNHSVPTTSGTVTITNSSGQVVRTATLGALSAGDNSLTWDGRDGSGNILPAGAYNFTVKGTSASGTAVSATTYTTGRVDGVSFVNNTPTLSIGYVTVPITDVISVKGV
jgi:flagellar basal-body rod modification protein FlgD